MAYSRDETLAFLAEVSGETDGEGEEVLDAFVATIITDALTDLEEDLAHQPPVGSTENGHRGEVPPDDLCNIEDKDEYFTGWISDLSEQTHVPPQQLPLYSTPNPHPGAASHEQEQQSSSSASGPNVGQQRTGAEPVSSTTTSLPAWGNINPRIEITIPMAVADPEDQISGNVSCIDAPDTSTSKSICDPKDSKSSNSHVKSISQTKFGGGTTTHVTGSGSSDAAHPLTQDTKSSDPAISENTASESLDPVHQDSDNITKVTSPRSEPSKQEPREVLDAAREVSRMGDADFGSGARPKCPSDNCENQGTEVGGIQVAKSTPDHKTFELQTILESKYEEVNSNCRQESEDNDYIPNVGINILSQWKSLTTDLGTDSAVGDLGGKDSISSLDLSPSLTNFFGDGNSTSPRHSTAIGENCGKIVISMPDPEEDSSLPPVTPYQSMESSSCCSPDLDNHNEAFLKESNSSEYLQVVQDGDIDVTHNSNAEPPYFDNASSWQHKMIYAGAEGGARLPDRAPRANYLDPIADSNKLVDENDKLNRRISELEMHREKEIATAYQNGRSDILDGLILAENTIVDQAGRLQNMENEREDLCEAMKIKEVEWESLSDQLYREIKQLRRQHCEALARHIESDSHMNDYAKKSLIRAKRDMEQALICTIERQNKINELKLFVWSQHQAIMEFERVIRDLEEKLTLKTLAQTRDGIITSSGDADFAALRTECSILANTCRSDALNVLFCDHSDYTPGVTTNPEISAANIFSFGGRKKVPDTMITGSFEMMKVPYVQTMFDATHHQETEESMTEFIEEIQQISQQPMGP